MVPPFHRPPSTWSRKFRPALRGISSAVRSQTNFLIHSAASAAVIVAAAALGASLVEWCLLVLCIAIVLAAELFNTAIEHVARAITNEHHDDIRDALDTSSGAVLVAAIGAAVVGVIVFAYRLGSALGW